MALPDPAGAEQSYWAALRLKPDDVESHFQLSRALLMQGKFEQGWLEYEWRHRYRTTTKRRYESPRWCGQPLDNKRLLLIAEEDARETLLLIRYADVLAQQSAKIAVQCQPALVPLLRGVLGVTISIGTDEAIPPHDYHLWLPSIPAVMGTRPDNIPAARPYLGVDAARLEEMQASFRAAGGVKVGLAFAGGDMRHADPVMRVVNEVVEATSRRHGADLVRMSAPNDATSDISQYMLDGWNSDRPDTDASAQILTLGAVLRSIDVLVSGDSLMLHMAGAMGVPTLAVLSPSHEPYWLLDREDSPWYPTMRIWRQRTNERLDSSRARIEGAVEAAVRLAAARSKKVEL